MTVNVVALDIGGTTTRCSLVDEAGQVTSRRNIATPRPPVRLEFVLSVIENLVSESLDGQVLGVGIAVAGIVDVNMGRIKIAPALGWRDLDLRNALAGRLNRTVFVENDVNAALVGEMKKGAGLGFRNSVMMSVGTGIGGAVWIDGQLYRGSNHAAGEIGYLAVEPEATKSAHTDWGFLESVASGPALTQRYLKSVGRRIHGNSGHPAQPGSLTAKDVFNAARSGDQIALRIVKETATYLGMAVANCIAVLDPEVVILGGGVLGSADLLLQPLATVARNLVPIPTPIVVASLGDKAALIGISMQVLNPANGEISKD